MRVSELAKALNLTSKELLVKLKQIKIEAKGPMSTLDADAVNRARKALVKAVPKKTQPAGRSAAAGKTSAAVRSVTAKAATGASPCGGCRARWQVRSRY